MKFSIFYLFKPQTREHHYRHFLHTTSMPIKVGLESLGHDVALIEDVVWPGRIPILFGAHAIGGFEYPGKLPKYIVVQTEVLTDRGLNKLETGRATEWLEHQYLPFLEKATAVWDVLPENIEFLAERGIEAHLYRGGFHEGLYEIPKLESEVDVGFVGTLDVHRVNILNELQDRGLTVRAIFEALPEFRNDFLARTRIQLCLRHGDYDHFPWQRPVFYLNNQLYSIMERGPGDEWLSNCIDCAEPDEFADFVCERAMLPDETLEHMAWELRMKLASRYPLKWHLEQLLEATL